MSPYQGILIKYQNKANLSYNYKKIPKMRGKNNNCKNFPPWLAGDLKNVFKVLIMSALNWTLTGAKDYDFSGTFKESFDELRSIVDKLSETIDLALCNFLKFL